MLTKFIFPLPRLPHVSLAFVGLMWTLPFLYYYHQYPINGFYQEWGAALLGLCAMFLLVTRRCWQRPAIPRIALLPIGLSLLVWLQFAMGKLAYLDQALLLTLYLLWAALLSMLGHRLRAELGLPALVTVLAASLLLGAELNALVGVLQHYRWHTFLDNVVAAKTGLAAIGNTGQPNHFADYITLGLISLGLLRMHWRMRIWQVALLAAPLLFVLTLSGSRSPWLYLLCVTGMAFLWQRRERKGGCLRQDRPQDERLAASPLRVDKSCLPLLHYSLALLLGFGLMHFVAQLPWLAGYSGGLASGGHVASGGQVTSGERLIAGIGEGGNGSSGGSVRLQIWREAWLIFTQFPWVGAGFGQFAWQHFQLGPVLRNTNTEITGLWPNAHNLLLQVAAEMGLVGLFILLGALALWFLQARAAQCSIYHWWGYGLLAVLAVHSLLEYPLWYTFFLGMAALTLGIFDTTTYRLEPRKKYPAPEGEGTITSSPLFGGARRGLAGRLSVAAMLLLGLLSLSQVLYLYRSCDFEVAAWTIHKSATDGSYAQRMRIQRVYDNMVAAQRHTLLLRPYVESFLGEAGWNHIADKGALNERVMHYLPVSSVAYRQAWLLAWAGQQAEAYVQMERAIWAYPESFPAIRDKLRALAGRDADPSGYPALLEFALQKYEERQRAVSAK